MNDGDLHFSFKALVRKPCKDDRAPSPPLGFSLVLIKTKDMFTRALETVHSHWALSRSPPEVLARGPPEATQDPICLLRLPVADDAQEEPGEQLPMMSPRLPRQAVPRSQGGNRCFLQPLQLETWLSALSLASGRARPGNWNAAEMVTCPRSSLSPLLPLPVMTETGPSRRPLVHQTALIAQFNATENHPFYNTKPWLCGNYPQQFTSPTRASSYTSARGPVTSFPQDPGLGTWFIFLYIASRMYTLYRFCQNKKNKTYKLRLPEKSHTCVKDSARWWTGH